MTSLLVLIPLALLLGLGALFAFFWAVRDGQFDDLEGSGSRILFDDDRPLAAGISTVPPAPGRPDAALQRRG